MNHADDAYCTVCKKVTPHDAVRPGRPRKCILCGRHEVKANDTAPAAPGAGNGGTR